MNNGTYRVAVIGDVHGQKKAFVALVEKLEKHGVDRIMSVGDLVDRGPDSQGCVEFVRTHKFTRRDGSVGKIEMILGNHEDSHLRVFLGLPWPGEKTVWKTSKHPSVYNSFKPEDWTFLLEQTYMLRDERLDLTILHGGVTPEDKTLGWMGKDRLSLTARTGYIGSKGERLKPGLFSGKFWTEQYDGRFGRIIYGHTTFNDVRFTKNTVGVDGSKRGKLFAVVVGEGEKDKTFEVSFSLFSSWGSSPKTQDKRGSKRSSNYSINRAFDNAYASDRRSAQTSFSWRNDPWDDEPIRHDSKDTEAMHSMFLELAEAQKKERAKTKAKRRKNVKKRREEAKKHVYGFEADQDLIDRVNQ